MELRIVTRTTLPRPPRVKREFVKIFCATKDGIVDMGLQTPSMADTIERANPKTAYIFMLPSAKIEDAQAAFEVQ